MTTTGDVFETSFCFFVLFHIVYACLTVFLTKLIDNKNDKKLYDKRWTYGSSRFHFILKTDRQTDRQCYSISDSLRRHLKTMAGKLGGLS